MLEILQLDVNIMILHFKILFYVYEVELKTRNSRVEIKCNVE